MNKDKNYIIEVIILVVLFLVFLFIFNNKTSYDYQHISGTSLVASDNSYLVLKDDNSFFWYIDQKNKEEYYYGTYTIYRGENAIEYISSNLSMYNLSEDYQRSYINQTKLEKGIDHYYLIILKNEKKVIKNQTELMSKETKYYGLADENYKVFKLINMDNSSVSTFSVD